MIKKLALSSFLMVSYMANAHSEGIAHNSDAPHGESGGLPQLDPSSFESQTFWLIIIFLSIYVYFSKKSLPQISQSIEVRADRIKNDLDTAERLKNEISSAQELYEESLKKARSEASSLFTDIEAKLKSKSEKNTKKFQTRSAKKASELEVKINDARNVVMKDMIQIAADIAGQATEKIIGVSTDSKNARAVVNSLNKAT